MLNLLLVETSSWILLGVAGAMIIAFIVLSYFRNKKTNENAQKVIDGLKKGDKVKTYSGIYGTVVEIVEKDGTKLVTIQTGTKKNPGFVTFDVRAVYAIEDETLKEVSKKAEETKTENNTEEKKEEEKPLPEKPVDEIKTENKQEPKKETKSKK